MDGERPGKYIEYYESGKVQWEVNYVDGLRQGWMLIYDPNGNISKQKRYTDDTCVESSERDE